jgi:hypothetical protein
MNCKRTLRQILVRVNDIETRDTFFFVKSKKVAQRRCYTKKISTLFENSFAFWQV